MIVLASGSRHDRVASGQLLNLGYATRHHSILMLCSFKNPILSQLEFVEVLE